VDFFEKLFHSLSIVIASEYHEPAACPVLDTGEINWRNWIASSALLSRNDG